MNDKQLLELIKSNPELLSQVQQAAARKEQISPDLLKQADGRPEFVFDWTYPAKIAEGEAVRIRNAFGQTRGGKILFAVGRAWLVESEGRQFVVHDPEHAWE